MKRLLILTRFPIEYEPRQLANAARENNLAPRIIAYQNIKIAKDKITLSDNSMLEDYEYLIPRSSAHRYKDSLIGLKESIIKNLPPGTKCLNQKTFQQWPVLGKSEQAKILTKAGVPAIPTWTTPQRFPAICKGQFGSHSQKTFRVENQKEVDRILATYPEEDFFFQPLINSVYYWRVLVLAGKPLGIMRRKTNSRLINSSKSVTGAFSLSFPSEKEISLLAIKAAKVLQCEFSGTDILVERSGRLLVIETNRAPQFEIFEKRTEIKVAWQVIRYMFIKK